MTYLDGAMVACGGGTAYAACYRANVSGRDVVLITGLGPVGLCATLLCRAMGARVVGVEAIPERFELAQKLGITDVGGLHLQVMVTHRFALDQAKEAYEAFDSGKTGKVAIVWE